MTREEKQKAIDALKISAPVRAMTQEEFSDYIQVINQAMDWLEQEPSYNSVNSSAEAKLKNPKAKTFDILHFIADNAGLSTYEAIEKAYIMGAFGKEPCEDAVSRQTAIDAIEKIHPVDTEYDCTLYDKIDVMYVLKDLPPVTPQPKTGQWVNGEYCSECGCDVPAYIIDWRWQKDMDAKYCPNCGIKMKGKSEE